MKRKFHHGEKRIWGNLYPDGHQGIPGVPFSQVNESSSEATATQGPFSPSFADSTGLVPEADTPPVAGTTSDQTEAERILRAFVRMMDLKGLYRQGWLKRGIPELRAESVADHSFGTALLALLLSNRLGKTEEFAGLDIHRCVEMALIHELGEVYAGDITPADGISKEEKYQREREAFVRVVAGLPEADRFLALWEEFESGTSPEARFVRQLDRLEMGIQAVLLKSEGFPRMDEFIESAHRSVTQGDLQSILKLAEAKISQSSGSGFP
ncbi:MAG TPA: HD domain-containing protein [Termitinemataceae bacterium]|nr:HD domain-containing protein [Termitinemataceae bacterium]HPQ01170.1 HD domain-containing protein [Termitinemataceae bacterium]